MIRRLVVVVLALSGLLLADDGTKQVVQVTKTEHMAFPSGGVLRLTNSIGDLMVEGWDQPDMQITTTKSTKAEYDSGERERGAQELDQVRSAVKRDGNEIVIGTDFHRHRIFPHPFHAGTRFDLQYDIKVPRSAQLFIDHDDGDVYIDNVTGGIHVTVRKGQITLRLPEEGGYVIDARSKFGGVYSDFPGQEERKLWFLGHEFTNPPSSRVRSGSLAGEKVSNPPSSAIPKLFLRVASGDIVIFKMTQPNIRPPLVQ